MSARSAPRMTYRPVSAMGTPASQAAPDLAPTFDLASVLWLSDGWPVLDPSATYDPDAPVRSAAETTQLTADCLTARGWTVTINGPASSWPTPLPPRSTRTGKTVQRRIRLALPLTHRRDGART